MINRVTRGLPDCLREQLESGSWHGRSNSVLLGSLCCWERLSYRPIAWYPSFFSSRGYNRRWYAECNVFNKKTLIFLAVLWKTTLRVAEWIGSYQNPLIHGGVLSPASTILELGCGVSAVLATSLSQWVSRYIATDQRYVLKLFEQNLRENAQQNVRRASEMDKSYSIEFLPLDWELDEIIQVCHVLDQDERSAGKGKNGGLDVVIACDCVYNEVLVEPFVETCRSLCSMRYADNAPQSMIPTLCVVAQQVRSSEVLELFLANMCRFFDVYRAKDGVLSSELSLGSGFTVHLAVLSQERDWTSDR